MKIGNWMGFEQKILVRGWVQACNFGTRMGVSAQPKIRPNTKYPPYDDRKRPQKEITGHPTEKSTDVTIIFLRTFLFVFTAELLWH